MSRKTISIIFIKLILVALVVYRYATYPYGLTPKNFKSLYKAEEAAGIDIYANQCMEEFAGKKRVPLAQVRKAVVCSGFFSHDKKLDESKTKQLLRILNDTASYTWGEVGTFIPDKKIVFYGNNNTAIGMTEIEEEGGHQSYSYPYLRRTKWGHLTQKALNQVTALISQ